MRLKKYLINNSYRASQGIATAVLVCLGVGLLLQNIGSLTDWLWLQKIGFASKSLFIPALGISIAISFRVSPMVIICAGITAIIGGGGVLLSEEGVFSIKPGEPVGAIIASLASIWIGKKTQGKTNFDIIIIPLIALLFGGIIGLCSSEIISPVLKAVSHGINTMTISSPIASSALISFLFALLILSPASSAALAIAFNLDPVSSAAALIGCSVQFTAFAFLGLKENSWGTFLGILICTPKLQTPNAIKYPRIMLIPSILAIIMAPLGILVFDITSVNEVAGLGLCAFVAPLQILSQQGITMFLQFLFVTILLPALFCLMIKPFAFKYGLLKIGELTVEK